MAGRHHDLCTYDVVTQHSCMDDEQQNEAPAAAQHRQNHTMIVLDNLWWVGVFVVLLSLQSDRP